MIDMTAMERSGIPSAGNGQFAADHRCPECGCSMKNACWTTFDHGCWWTPDGRCSACYDPSIRVAGPLGDRDILIDTIARVNASRILRRYIKANASRGTGLAIPAELDTPEDRAAVYAQIEEFAAFIAPPAATGPVVPHVYDEMPLTRLDMADEVLSEP